jgi:hypothetical protein
VVELGRRLGARLVELLQPGTALVAIAGRESSQARRARLEQAINPD